jgi:hypothetical protein
MSRKAPFDRLRVLFVGAFVEPVETNAQGEPSEMAAKTSECCIPAAAEPTCCACKSSAAPKHATAVLTPADHWGAIMCRLSNRFRMRYNLDAGLYAVGNPDENSPVLVTANYRLSFNCVRKALAETNAWVLVLDTKGINVWCAAGKGTFGTGELVKRISAVGLANIVKHRTIILPQLGAPGVAAHEVKKSTGFKVEYGPVRAEDIPEYLSKGNQVTPAMRTVEFSLWDRMVLTPMEFLPALRKYLWVVLGCAAIMGLQPSGILFKIAFDHSWPIVLAGLLAVFAGSIVTPMLLPVIPFRSFAAKGALAGAIFLAPTLLHIRRFYCENISLAAASAVFFTAVASYLALNFTGCTPFTNISGVKKEMRFAVPAYITACAVSAILLCIFKLQECGTL